MVTFQAINNTSTVRGRGMVRKVTGSLVGAVGNAVVNAIAKSISGGSYKMAGRGTKKPRATKKTCGSGVKRVKRVVRRRRKV